MSKTQFFVCFFTIYSISLAAQEQLGLRLDNYGGVNSLILNPSANATTPFSWDVNLVEAGFFLDNNYAFFENRNLFDFTKDLSDAQFELRPDLTNDTQVDEDAYILDFVQDGRKRYVQQLTSVMGPSFYVRLNNKHRIGLLTRARVMVSARRIPNEFSYYDYESRAFGSEFTADPFQANVMSWTELGLNYNYTTATSAGQFSLGVTLKFLQGYEAVYFQNNQSSTLLKDSEDTFGLGNLDLSYGFTTSNLNEEEDFELQQNGSGLGLDVGITYTIGELENQYDWKFGVALLDLGRIDFRSSERHELQFNQLDPTIIMGEDFEDYNTLEDLSPLVKEFSEQILDDALETFQVDKISIWLPAALSLQVDRRLTPSIYLNATLVQGIPFRSVAIERGSFLALTPRYESRWLGAALPVSLYEWQRFRVGAAVRLGFLHLGTEHLGSLFSKSDFYGTDFYVALKVNPFKIRFGKKGGKWKPGKNKRMKVGNGKVRCYQF